MHQDQENTNATNDNLKRRQLINEHLKTVENITLLCSTTVGDSLLHK